MHWARFFNYIFLLQARSTQAVETKEAIKLAKAELQYMSYILTKNIYKILDTISILSLNLFNVNDIVCIKQILKPVML